MIGVVVDPELKKRLEEAARRERRQSFSEFCCLLLEYGEWKLAKVGGLNVLLAEMQKEAAQRAYEAHTQGKEQSKISRLKKSS